MTKRPSASFNDPGYFYSQRRLLKIFAISSTVLMIGILAMIWQDFDRPWKEDQREERKFEAARFSLERMILQTQTVSDRAQIAKQRQAAREKVAAHEQELAELEKELNVARGEFYQADMLFKAQKQYTGEAEYNTDEAKDEASRALWQKRLRDERDKEHRLRDASQAAAAKLDFWLAKKKTLEKSLDDVVAAERKNAMLKRMKLLAAGIEKNRSYNPLREVPLLDFLAPPTKVEQVVLANLVDNYEFSRPNKVDRCGTCHMRSMRAGYEAAKFPVEILDPDYEADPQDPTTARARVFERGVYNLVYALIGSVWPKVAGKPDYARERNLLRDAEIHHRVLDILFEQYDREDGEIGLETVGKQERKVWRRWSFSEEKGEWVADKQGHSIAEYYYALLKRMRRHWRTHPHFQDMVGDASPHPYEKFGCTSCHRGRGWSVDFGLAYHTPDRKRIGDWMTSGWATRHGHPKPANARQTLDEAMAAGRVAGDEYAVDVGWVLDHDRGRVWERELGWTHEKTHSWHWPQPPMMLVQSSCLKCHKEGLYATPEPEYAGVHLGMPDPDVPKIVAWEDHAKEFFDDPEADRAGEYAGRIFLPRREKPYRPTNLERGLDSFLRFGCYGCHKLDPKRYPFMATMRPKVGPPLDEVASKTTREFIRKWVRNPKAFRKDTRMPRFFGLSNNPKSFRYRFAAGHDDLVNGEEWNEAEVYAIVEWIWDQSSGRARSYPEVDLSKGDPARGARIVIADFEGSKAKAKACIACHHVPVPTALKYDSAGMALWEDRQNRQAGGWAARMSRRHGPDLAGIGSKVDKNWLFAWLKDPRGYWHDTNMPNLRLTDQEALDVAAFLMTLRNEEFEKLPGVSKNDFTMKMVAEELKVSEQQESTADAINIVKQWSARERTLYVGRKLVKHYGCFGCHQIERYKETTPIGTELTEWGSKLIGRLEFNHAPIDHTRFDFAYTKLINPRIYDHGWARQDRPLERLRMPRFGFRPSEARDLATFLIGLVNDPIPEPSLFRPNQRQQEIIRGRQVLARYNCQGCHMIEGKGGDIWPVIPKVNWRPPDLLGQGAKTNPAWLFRFLKDPLFVTSYGPADEERLRPWHSIRMPTFSLSDEEARALVRYFSALSDETSSYESGASDSLARAGQGYPKRFEVKDPTDVEGQRTITITVHNRLEETETMFRAYSCKSCHSSDPDVPIANRAPNFRHVRQGRLRSGWIMRWLWGPYKLQKGTKMPSFFGQREPKPQDDHFFQFDPAKPDSREARARTAAEQVRVLRDYIRYHYEDK